MNIYLDNICPLCKKIQSSLLFTDKNRDYLQCDHCQLIYVPKKCHLSSEDEKKQYDLHQNSPDDNNYRGFLSRLFKPMIERLSPAHNGLDFGSGPGPTLSLMFEECGFEMQIYDLFYANKPQPFSYKYDFITATEVIEHLKHPDNEISRLLGLLKPAGILGIMTKLVTDKESFKTWHYKNDPTHICFYSQDTFNWIAEHYSLKVEFIAADVIILEKFN